MEEFLGVGFYHERHWDDDAFKHMFWSGQILLLKEDHRPSIGFIDYTLWCADPPSIPAFPGGKAIHSVMEPEPVVSSILRSDRTTRSQESVPSEQSTLEPQWEHWLIDLGTMKPVPTQGPMPERSCPRPVPGNFLDEPDTLPAPLFRFCPLATYIPGLACTAGAARLLGSTLAADSLQLSGSTSGSSTSCSAL